MDQLPAKKPAGCSGVAATAGEGLVAAAAAGLVAPAAAGLVTAPGAPGWPTAGACPAGGCPTAPGSPGGGGCCCPCARAHLYFEISTLQGRKQVLEIAFT